MAGLSVACRSALATLFRPQIACRSLCASRCLSTHPSAEPDDKHKGWLGGFGRLLVGDSTKTSHSKLLADKDKDVYEMQLHKVKPEYMEDYLKQYTTYVQLVKEKDSGAELVGSWTTEIGEQDEAVHVWRYGGGYETLNNATTLYRTDKDFIDFRINRNKMLRKRKNEILLAFSFWGDIKPRDGKNIYELRSYTLKPGTMIEWANSWARGIQFRKEDAVAGFFTNIGEIYEVTHFWAYESLQSRKEVRESAWRRPGWDECVAHTVPLIRHCSTRILIPTPFSPMQ